MLALKFRDELRDRHCLPLLSVPSYCGGCSAKLSTAHDFPCKVGGLTHQRHDKIRGSITCLASTGFSPSNARDEPLTHSCRDSDHEASISKARDGQIGLAAELNSDRGGTLIRCFWSRDADYTADTRACGANQLSHESRASEAVIKSVEINKKRKCLGLCLEQRRHFTPFVASCEGMMGKEAGAFVHRLAQRLSKKWHRPHSRTVGFIRLRFAISLVRAKNRCLRGSRTMTNSISRRIDLEDGAGLGLYSTLE